MSINNLRILLNILSSRKIAAEQKIERLFAESRTQQDYLGSCRETVRVELHLKKAKLVGQLFDIQIEVGFDTKDFKIVGTRRRFLHDATLAAEEDVGLGDHTTTLPAVHSIITSG